MRRHKVVLISVVFILLGSWYFSTSDARFVQSYNATLLCQHETCFACAHQADPTTQDIRFLAARYKTPFGAWVRPQIPICQACVTRHGWPLPDRQQKDAISRWRAVQIDYYRGEEHRPGARQRLTLMLETIESYPGN